ncbi:hypothetical protein VD0004_g4246 [Verticillium dahliae]|nr:hypothetical protein VD0004_g4246 [Verticillium dahliae]
MPHVLILGGHGKIAQHLTPLLLRASHTVTSVIRADDQTPTIRGLAPADGRGTLHVLIRSLEDVTSQDRAQAILSEGKPDAVVFSAGAGGKGGADRTRIIDRDAATHFLRAASATPSVKKFILISYLASRRAQPAWWDAAAWADAQKVNTTLAAYYDAKVAADEVLYEAGGARRDFAAVSLRPGTLTEGDVGGVELGRTGGAKGEVSRRTVAEVTARLVDAEGLQTSWVDLLDGQEDIDEAVKRVVKEGVDVAEGEPVYDKVRKA